MAVLRALPLFIWRTASNKTIATAVAKFRLRVPCIGMVMQFSMFAASKFSGKYAHRTISGGVGHNLPQEAPQAFAEAIVDAGRC